MKILKKVKAWRRKNYQLKRDQILQKRKKYLKNDPRITMLISARHRAKVGGYPCTITKDDIAIPEICPVLGMPLESGTKGFHESAPTLDKINPELGYVPGNVVVISFLANRVKSNATIEQIRKVADYYAARAA